MYASHQFRSDKRFMTVASKLSSQTDETLEKAEESQVLNALAKFWNSAQPMLTEVRPYVAKLLPVLTTATQHTTSLVKRYYNDDMGRVMWNVMLVFFGGQFALTIMAIQAFQLTGSVVIEKSLSQLKDQFREAMNKFQMDKDAREIFDANNDGVITLDEVTQAVMATINGETSSVRDKNRKMVAICMRCIDPSRLSEAATGFMMGSLAIIATLRSKMAKCIAIGTKIGEHLAIFMTARTQKPLYVKFPEHTKWVDVGLKSGSALVGIIVSFLLTKIINAFNCALQGAEALSVIILDYAHKRGKLMHVRHGDNLVQAATMAIVFFGVMTQLKTGFRLPWYLKLLMLPAVASENILALLAVV
jgi:hypothetical protein